MLSVAFMPSVKNKPFMLSVIMLNVLMLIVVMLNVVMLSVIVLNVLFLLVPYSVFTSFSFLLLHCQCSIASATCVGLFQTKTFNILNF